MHNFIFINYYIIKLQYFIYRIDEIIDIIIKFKYIIFFYINIYNDY